MMKIACGLLLLLAGLLVWRERQKRKTAEARMEKLSQDINHFVIYQDNPLEETLEEGALYNLYNQIAKLETQYLYSIRAQKKRFLDKMGIGKTGIFSCYGTIGANKGIGVINDSFVKLGRIQTIEGKLPDKPGEIAVEVDLLSALG